MALLWILKVEDGKNQQQTPVSDLGLKSGVLKHQLPLSTTKTFEVLIKSREARVHWRQSGGFTVTGAQRFQAQQVAFIVLLHILNRFIIKNSMIQIQIHVYAF
ncbi:hypothetical protein E4U21_001580 [Claviceps maximensis]|nr:hypothetical protein E4U21_001580 [Claviceps maximensis]